MKKKSPEIVFRGKYLLPVVAIAYTSLLVINKKPSPEGPVFQ